MINSVLAKIFSEIAIYLEMQNIPFKPQAYENAATAIESLTENIEDIYKKGERVAIEKIPGIGKHIAEKIIEYLKTGKIKDYQNLKKKIPVDIGELILIEGIGPKAVKAFWEHLKIKNVEDLEKAASLGKIRNLPGFGQKTEKNILEGIKFLKRSKGRFLLADILPKAREIEKKLKPLKEVEQISVAGSVRRKKETIGDVDFLITTKKEKSIKKIIKFFCSLPGVVKIWGKGPTKSSVRMEEGFDVDLRIVNKKSFGSALQYFTGSKEHNIQARTLAIERGLKLNEYGVFKGKKMIAGWHEPGIYKALGIPFIGPELRENRGEIEAAQKNNLPRLITVDDIKGDLHTHCNWNGGKDSIENMAKEAINMGYEYLGIADHTKFLRIENGLDEKQLEKRNKEIDKINKKISKKGKSFIILKGCETNILDKGKVDIDDKALAKLDYVIAGVHSRFKISKKEMTERIVRAMENPHIDIISHPTGRLLKKREEYQIDFAKILEVAKKTRTILEINAWPERLDLNDTNIKKAKEAGVKMIINTDAHQKDQLYFMEYGISQARRGWAEKKDIINTNSSKELMSFFK